ncbi:hypothetical protein KBC79_03195 [Candidatus Woesebacteria bacterium]|nr:hypothetical protein [Candidatus Woesebacteria bacterium]
MTYPENTERADLVLAPNSELERQKRMLDTVRAFYLLHETELSKRMMVATQDLQRNFELLGDAATFLLGGSVGFGQATNETMDIDMTYVGKLPNSFRSRIGKIVLDFNAADLHIEHVDYDVIDVVLVEAFVQHVEFGTPYSELIGEEYNEEYIEQHFKKFVSMFCVTRKLDDRYAPLFVKAISLEHRIIDELRETLSLDNSILGVRSSDFIQSFGKYHARLAARGITVPAEIIELEKQLTQ